MALSRDLRFGLSLNFRIASYLMLNDIKLNPLPTSITIRVASQPRNEKIPREQATEHKTIITPDNPTTDLACIRFEAQLS